MVADRDIVAEMLTENTGRHLLDSGGAYGRNWERNQGRDFASEPESTLSVWKADDWYVTHSVYHWLRERADYLPELDAAFHAWATTGANEDRGWLELMEEWATDIMGGAGIYGDGPPMTVNTYNGEDLLSQTLQYVYWSTGERGGRDEYALVQVHGGCDVRGGYTAPRLFRVGIEEGWLDNARASLVCSSCEDGRYYTDDGYNWYCDSGPSLKDYPTLTCKRDHGHGRGGYLVAVPDSANDGRGRLYCPACGVGQLHPCTY